ncbi:NADP oxidoreductase [Clavibacter lycopersici]|uniref:NADP oxidoreductase n=1 Tax=Clavibacter lycopersici TaxID=2301718 RepID=A0A399TGC6_9MICO|nr:NADP oxidoreductase [Clavibacter lycopersici]RIJ62510.1 NADP oxidoreductase [Clavibacter lycopersici]
MKIGIIGTGMIGATLAQRLAGAGHDVSIANSRGPETISGKVLSTGARAVDATDVATGVDALIVSVPLNRIPDIAPLVRDSPEDAAVIDTSNYYPMRDEAIAELDAGQVESVWVSEQYGRTVIKAWNAIGAQSFAEHGTPKGTAGRIAIPVAGDDADAQALAMSLVEDTGFDAFDAGSLAGSWRQQPGTPAYCTDLAAEEMPAALAKADRDRSARRRDLVIDVVTERAEAEGGVSGDYLVRLNRAIH